MSDRMLEALLYAIPISMLISFAVILFFKQKIKRINTRIEGLKTNIEFNEAHLHGLKRARYLLNQDILMVEGKIGLQQEWEKEREGGPAEG